MSDEWESIGAEAAQSFDLDASDINPEDLTRGGEKIDKEGWYHLEVRSVKPDFEMTNKKGEERSPRVSFELVCLETVPGQSPAEFRHFHAVYLRSKTGTDVDPYVKRSAINFGIGLGLLEVKAIGDVEKVVVKGTNDTKIPASLWANAQGRQICCKLVMQKEGKFAGSLEIKDGRVYHPADPMVSEVPKNAQALKNAGIDAPLGNKNPATKDNPNGAAAGKAKGGSKKAEKETAAAGPPKDDDPLAGM